MIQRYTLAERSIHWLTALAYTYVLLTGLAFYSPHLYWIAVVLGGAPTSRFWHPWLGLLFFAGIIWMLQAWRADMAITAGDREWGKAMDHYIRNEDESLPPADRFNVGQKYFFWVMLWGGVLLLISGVVLWFPERIPWSLRGIRYAAILLHVSAALITIGAFIIHVYMGTAMVRGGFTSIIRGEVSPAWARMHHRLWYERVAAADRGR
jgi:formate dehydrogenase subunit gamma